MPSCDRGVSTAPGGAAAGAATGAAAGAAGAGAAGAAEAPAPSPLALTVAMRSPLLTLPPLVVCSFSSTPSTVDGTSMVAFSDSSVTSGVSTAILSPGFTSTSMTATSLKLPMSGTRTSVRPTAAFMSGRSASALPGYGLLGIDAECLDGLGDGRVIHAAVVGPRLEGGHGDVVAVHLEVPAQLRARIGAPVAVGAERHVAAAHPLADLVRDAAHVVGRRHHRSLAAFQHLPHVGNARRLLRVQHVPALAFERLAAQLAETGDRQHVRRDAVVVLENLRRRLALAQDGARAEQGRPYLAAAADLQQVAAAQDPGLDPGRNRRLQVVLVHQRDVIENALLLHVHAAHAVVDDDGQLVGERRVIGHAVGNRARDQLAVAVLVLQPLAGERGATGGGAQQEAARLDIPGGPDEIPDALEAEHRIEDIERHHVDAVIAVGGAGGHPRAQRAGLVDALLDHLPLLVLAVGHQGLGVLRRIQLADGGIDADLAEQPFHAEGARLVRHDRHDVAADVLVLEQHGEHAHERHGGGDLALPGALEQRRERLQRRHHQRRRGAPALRQGGAEGCAFLADIARLVGILVGLAERQAGQILVRDRDVEAIAEDAQVLLGEFLLLMRHHLSLAALAEAEALHGLGEDHGRLSLVRHGGRVGGIHLARIVAAAVQVPDLLVGHVGDHRLELGELAEEVLAGVRPALRLEVLVLAVDALLHHAAQQPLMVARQQRIPARAPQHLDDVPAGAEERRLELLDDLAVAAYRAIEALQVAVDDEDEIVESFAHRHGERAHRLRLVHLAVTEK